MVGMFFFIRLMRSNLVGPVNIGNPVEFTVRELAEIVIELTGSSSKLIFQPLPADDPKQRRPDISLARRELEWTPAVDLRAGLGRTIKYFDGLMRSPDNYSVPASASLAS